MATEIGEAVRTDTALLRCIPRGAAAAVLGALAGATWLVLTYALHPAVTVNLDRDMQAIATGFYPAERSPSGVFAWTTSRAALRLQGLDRRTSWTCLVGFRGARQDPATLPDVTFGVDGVNVATIRATNEFQQATIAVPPRLAGRDLVLGITPSNTFTPGPQDPRQLGVMVNEVSCRPAGNGIALAPRNTVANAGLASAVFGGAIGLTGVTPGSAVVGTIVLAAAQTVPLSDGIAPYVGYAARAPWLAFWIALATVVAVRLPERVLRQPFRNTARFAVVFSAGALYLKLLALLHPSKAIVDALFQAHRLEWVLAGRFYFTQTVSASVRFPYAIGLYLFAAPWSLVTSDYVTLLRVIVCAAEVITGALLYLVIVRTWGDRLEAAVAVALFNLVPLSYVVVGNGNLTNAFGQSAALAVLAVATIWPLEPARPARMVAVVLLATLAFVSHVSTFALLVATLLALSAIYRFFGGPALRPAARRLFAATAIAFLVAVAGYYSHFGELYNWVARVRGQSAAAVTTGSGPRTQPGERNARDEPVAQEAGPGRPRIGEGVEPRTPATPTGRAKPPSGLPGRLADALVATVDGIGWPILILAIVGAWRLAEDGPRDRLTYLLAAWGLACLAFLGVGILTRVDVQYQRYALEFVSRAELAAYPAAVILAARAGAWGWRAGAWRRVASAALLLAAVVVGVQQWARWLN